MMTLTTLTTLTTFAVDKNTAVGQNVFTLAFTCSAKCHIEKPQTVVRSGPILTLMTDDSEDSEDFEDSDNSANSDDYDNGDDFDNIKYFQLRFCLFTKFVRLAYTFL